MTVDRQRGVASIFVNGQEWLWHGGARITTSFEQSVGSLHFRVPTSKFDRARLPLNSWVVAFLGPTWGETEQEFAGFISDMNPHLWPDSVAIQADDVLMLAREYEAENDVDLSGGTDEQAVEGILLECDVPPSMLSIEGTGTVIGSTFTGTSHPAIWKQGQSGLAKIEEYDRVSIEEVSTDVYRAYRTRATRGGLITRRPYTTLPGTTVVASYYQGQNILDGDTKVTVKDRTIRATVTGFQNVTYTAISDSAGNNQSGRSWSGSLLLVESDSLGGSGISAEQVAEWRLSQTDYWFVEVSFLTQDSTRIAPGDAIYVESAKLFVNQIGFVKAVDTEVTADGFFARRVTFVSQLGLGSLNQQLIERIPGGAGGIGGPVTPPTPPTQPPAAGDIRPDFSILSIDKERVIIAGAATDMYVVTAVDSSQVLQGAITGRTWLATGAYSGMPTGGTDTYFTTAFASLAGAKIKLTVTTAYGSNFIEKTLTDGAGVPIRSRKLYVAGGPVLEAWTGTQWNTYTLPAGSCAVVANGPAWGVGDDVYYSSDDLATTPSSSTPSGGVNVTALWIEPDIDEDQVAAGLADGTIALSSDGGATWTVKDGPDANAVDKIILSRFNPGQIHLASASGHWISTDSGASWTTAGSSSDGDYRDLDLNPHRNWAVEFLTGQGYMVQSEPGTQQTGTGADDIVAVTSHIRNDRGYAVAADGSTWYHATDAATALTAGADLPAGCTANGAGSLYRDGAQIDLVYLAATKLIKSVDGLRTAGAYLVLREAGVDGASASFDASQVGVGLMAVPGGSGAPGGARRVYLTSTRGASSVANGLYKSADDGASWALIRAIDSTEALRCAVHPVAGGADVIYLAERLSGIHKSTDGGSTWSLLSTPWSLSPVTRVSLIDADTVYVSLTNNSLYRTTDGGSNWTLLSASEFADPGVAATTKVWTLRNTGSNNARRYDLDGTGGETLTGFGGNPLDLSVVSASVAFYFFEFDVYGLYRVDATTVSDITPPGALATEPWISARSPDGVTILALIFDQQGSAGLGQLWRSTDSGASWAKVAEDADLRPWLGRAESLQYDPNDTTLWYCAGGRKQDGVAAEFWTSSDGGATWASAGIVASDQWYIGDVRVASA